jgi:hypothetical protein
LIPDPFATTKREFDRMPRPRIIKSHECFDPRYPRVIYIIRDPRDVACSQYHYHRKLEKIDDNSPIDRFISRFLAGQTCPHGSWRQNVVTWLSTRENDSSFLLLRYEDMLADTARELQKVATFLGLNATAEQIARAVERSSAGQMRKMEQAQSDKCDLIKDSRKDLSFVRAASSGGWRSELSPSLVARIETAWGPLMRHLGYDLATEPQTSVVEPAFPISMMTGPR